MRDEGRGEWGGAQGLWIGGPWPFPVPPLSLMLQGWQQLVECNWLHYSEQVPDEVLPIIIKGLSLRGTSLWPSLLQERLDWPSSAASGGLPFGQLRLILLVAPQGDSLVHLGLPFSKVG